MAEVKEIVDPISVDANRAVLSRQGRRSIGIGIGIRNRRTVEARVVHCLHGSPHAERVCPSSVKPAAIIIPDTNATLIFPVSPLINRLKSSPSPLPPTRYFALSLITIF